MFNFKVIGKNIVKKIVDEDFNEGFSKIRDCYLDYSRGLAVNPPSGFLRFPHKPNARIISLPAYLGGDSSSCGIKWIASFPDNIEKGFQRASAVFVLNDSETGYPLACIESSYISAVRTAISAVMAGEELHRKETKNKKLAIIGAGFISRMILKSFEKRNWSFDSIAIFDKNKAYAEAFLKDPQCAASSVSVSSSLDSAIKGSDTIVFATTSLSPYVSDSDLFAHHPVVLHVSLRDLSEELILSADNYTDDVGHVLAADTSPHLAFKKVGKKDFMKATIADLIRGDAEINSLKTRIFSPMGMGILDLALADWVYQKSVAEGVGVDLPDFFGDLSRC